ncbi:uncharacterized protein [Aegilops tauschii subsp. strangulata]|uniref:uncharacterized protein n=1 Tax=Aegilops tauschii subsp. strangulata TaxID=200361 RepID=UPI001ABC14B8|nr:uncharacterized protein LOC120966821 [Aegilops tauschii subsp. strangulata]
MCKWIWRLSQGETGLWLDFLRAKYFPSDNFFASTGSGFLFWNSIQALRPIFAMGAKFSVKGGRSTRFWLDLWIGDQPLWSRFRDLYNIALEPNFFVAQAMGVSPPGLLFRLELTGSETTSLGNLLTLVGEVTISQGPDIVS